MADRDDPARRGPRRPPRDESPDDDNGSDRKLQVGMTLALLAMLGMLAVQHLSWAAQTRPYH